jgi:hypothetical protein
MKVDLSAIADSTYMRCYVPFTKELLVSIQTITGAASIYAGFIVGYRRLTLADRVKWGLEFGDDPKSIDEAKSYMSKYPDFYERIKAGLL